MKAITILLMAFYILLLGLMPCSDCAEFVDQYAQIATVHNPHAQDTPRHLDFCSPLCTCSCCHIGIDQPESFFTPYAGINSDIRNMIPPVSHSQEIASTFWQPPKIG